MHSIIEARSAAQITQARELMLEYARSLGISLSFQNFDEEMATLPGAYAPPEGCLLLARVNAEANNKADGELAGCVALRKFEPGICEMKRLYVRPRFRGLGLGKTLALKIIAKARALGYKRMRLDTIEPLMKDAVGLYLRLDFHEIPAYRVNPMPQTRYLELDL
jgi:putative acetyltransferase